VKKISGLFVFSVIAIAHEYPLQFTPNAGYRGLVVAGYQFSGDTVVGNCSYYTVRSGSGKGGGYHTSTTYYNQTCTWDSFGNLLSVTPGAPTVPTPLYVNGTQTVYAMNADGGTTGYDSSLRAGFVNTPGSHYTWVTSSAYAVLQQIVYTMPITLESDGDLPLTIDSVQASALRSKVTVMNSTCSGQIAVGATCTITLKFDPTKLSSPTGLAYDTLTVAVVSDAGQSPSFVQSYTIAVKVPVDDGDN
jgi:hypothetical protein